MDDRIPTELWVSAHIRQATTKGLAMYVVRKGASASGTVMVKVVIRGQGCRLFNQSRDLEGRMGWMDIYEGAIAEEAKADEYIDRAVKRDPDVWVIEAEDASGKNPFEGKVF